MFQQSDTYDHTLTSHRVNRIWKEQHHVTPWVRKPRPLVNLPEIDARRVIPADRKPPRVVHGAIQPVEPD